MEVKCECDSDCKTMNQLEALLDLAMGYVVGDGLDIIKLSINLDKVCERLEKKGIEFDISSIQESAFMAAL